MTPTDFSLESLKALLEESAAAPSRLDAHPWVNRPGASLCPQKNLPPGERLLCALTHLFAQNLPATPPRQGKRLDTHWAECGLLAALYFAPLRFHTPRPASLRDAWGRIDESILLFVEAQKGHPLSETEKDAYRLVSREPEPAPLSTLSDWRRNGLTRLLQALRTEEEHLKAPPRRPSPAPARRWLKGLLTLSLIALLLFLSLQGWQLYQQARQLQSDLQTLQNALTASPNPLEQARQAGPLLVKTRADLQALQAQAQPYLWLTPWMAWFPTYGGEIAQSQTLIVYAQNSLQAAEAAYHGLLPFLDEETITNLTPSRLAELLGQAQPDLQSAQTFLNQALQARARLTPQTFSPSSRRLLLEKLDPLALKMQDALTLGLALPNLLGSSAEGPKTYLLLAQNEDELRPTGGFITAVGTLLIQNGHILSLDFINSDALDDWSKPYPLAPWQMSAYMNIPLLTLRDASWFTDYRVSAQYAEQFYALTTGHSADGVIAFNQNLLVRFLRVTGPIILKEKNVTITADTVITYMRQAKTRTEADLKDPQWNYKGFIDAIGKTLLDTLLYGKVDKKALAQTVIAALTERDLLLQIDDPLFAEFLSRNGWDGALNPANGDFLLLSDANIGYNKTSPVIETTLAYDVDLRSPFAPSAILQITHQNNAAALFTCQQLGKNKSRLPKEGRYPITDCYWDYLRVYRPQGTTLQESQAQFIPANWLIRYRSVPPQVDVLTEDEAPNLAVFGTLKVIPGGKSETTLMRFSLPLTVLAAEGQPGWLTYRLRVQKQPGSRNIALQLHIFLPPGAETGPLPAGLSRQGSLLTLEQPLTEDLNLLLSFHAP